MISLYINKYQVFSIGLRMKKKRKILLQIILTMYYRAHHHPYKTKDMEKAMKIFKKWLVNNGYSNSIIK